MTTINCFRSQLSTAFGVNYQLLSESTAFGVNCQLSTINCQLINDLFSLCFNFDIRFLAATASSAIAACRSSE
ncbi:hypothetical protein Q5689_20740 [Microcoleus sp. ARI1-A2]|uniref:hypothetical protein n=1 Tax=Microcoleus sp. ARI1-A2 TaxID=2818557 RepID=UPI002FD5436C